MGWAVRQNVASGWTKVATPQGIQLANQGLCEATSEERELHTLLSVILLRLRRSK